MLDDWAFARVELHMSEAEFFALSPRQWQALMDQWTDKQEREFAIRTTIAYNARFASKNNMCPFVVKDFLPPDPLAPEEEAERKARLKKHKEIMLIKHYEDMMRDLPPITPPKPIKLKRKKKRGK